MFKPSQSVVGQSAWNDLPFELRSLLMVTLPNFTSLLSPSSLAVTGLGVPQSLLYRCCINLQNEGMKMNPLML